MQSNISNPFHYLSSITLERAREYLKNYLLKREQGVCNKCDTISVWFSKEDLLALAAQAFLDGSLLSGVRIYFGAHTQGGNNTLVLVPTSKKGNTHEDILTEPFPWPSYEILTVNDGQQCPPETGPIVNQCDGTGLLDDLRQKMTDEGTATDNLFRKTC